MRVTSVQMLIAAAAFVLIGTLGAIRSYEIREAKRDAAIAGVERSVAPSVAKKVKEELRPEIGATLAEERLRIETERKAVLTRVEKQIKEANSRAGIAQDKALRVDRRLEDRFKRHEKKIVEE